MNTYESCVLCKTKTNVEIEEHIDNREHYIEGAGQLCEDCHNITYNNPRFTQKNNVTCHDTPMWKVLFEYVCWFLAGKPEGYNGRHQ